jgi:hypothetical protein
MKCKCRYESLDDLFKREVHDRIKTIDPKDERDRHDFAWGWAIGKGMHPLAAEEFAFHIQHHKRLA